jgi:hypothetical protein
MTKSLMIDLETLATSTDAVILTLGAVKFDLYSDADPWDPVYLKLEIDPQLALGRRVSDDTLAWWGKQSAEAQAEAFDENDRISLADAVAEIRRAVAHCSEIWAQGPQFDISMLEHLFRSLGEPIPWSYGQVRDSRTVLSASPDCRIFPEQAHNSLADAYCQALSVRAFYRKYGILNPRA